MVKKIDLKPHLIEALNKQLIEVLKMPKELFKQYNSKPYLTNPEQVYLTKAAEAYAADQLSEAITYYKKCATSMARMNTVEINNNELSHWYIVIQFLVSKCLYRLGAVMKLIEAHDILLQLDRSDIRRYPMIYCLLCRIYIKLFCFERAERVINKGLGILNDKNIELITCYVPILNEVIYESMIPGVSVALLGLKSQCANWHCPDGICFMTNCSDNSKFYLSDRNIYYDSPAFDGMVVLLCDNVNPCHITFHKSCWKAQKKLLAPVDKRMDRNFLNSNCLTPDCERNSIPNKIIKIETHNSRDKIIFIEIPPEKRNHQNIIPRTGAISKCKVELNGTKVTKEKIMKNNKKAENRLPQDGNTQDEDAINSHKLKMKHLRENNFNIDKNNDWRPDLLHYGNLNFQMKYDNIKYEFENTNGNEKLSHVKLFLYSFFESFISKNSPVKVETFKQEWHKVTSTMGTREDDWKDFIYMDPIEFILKSQKFTVIGDYICTPESMPEIHELVRRNTGTALRCLMNSHVLSKKDENNSDILVEETDGKNSPMFTVLHHDETPSQTHQELISKKEMIVTKNNTEDYQNETITIDNIPNGINENLFQQLNQNDIDKGFIDIKKLKEANDMIESLQQQLKMTNDKLDKRKLELDEMKLKLLRMKLDSEFGIITLFISNQHLNCSMNFLIINTLENLLTEMSGSKVTLGEQNWSIITDELTKITHNIQQKYNDLTTMLNCNYSQDLGSVNLDMPILPKIPPISIPGVLQKAFYMLHRHFYDLANKSKTMMPGPSSYPPFNAMTNPPFNTMTNPPFNTMTNPPFNSMTNPPFNSMTNPSFNSMTNPAFNPLTNPAFNPMTNPPFNPISNPSMFVPNFQSYPVYPVWTPPASVPTLPFMTNTFPSYRPPTNTSIPKTNYNMEPNILGGTQQPWKAPLNENEAFNNTTSLNKNEAFNNTTSLNVHQKDQNHLSEEKIEKSPEKLEEVKPSIIQPEEEAQESDESSSNQSNGKTEDFEESNNYVEVKVERPDKSQCEAANCNDEFQNDLIIDDEVNGIDKETPSLLNINKLMKAHSLDILLNLLRSKYKGVLEFDLLWSVNQVKKMHNNSLSGLSLSMIVNEVKKQLIYREKLQLACYPEKTVKDHPRNVPNRSRKRETSTSSTSSHKSTISVTTENVSKKNPWTPINNAFSTWSPNNSQNDCVICFDDFKKNQLGDKAVYTLRCKHKFHTKCIKDWFKENKTCPTCRIYSTMDEEFPPL